MDVPWGFKRHYRGVPRGFKSFKSVPWVLKGLHGSSRGSQGVLGAFKEFYKRITWVFPNVPGSFRGFRGPMGIPRLFQRLSSESSRNFLATLLNLDAYFHFFLLYFSRKSESFDVFYYTDSILPNRKQIQ